MNSSILESIGLGNIDIFFIFLLLLVLIIVLFVLVCVQASALKKLNKNYTKFMKGKNAGSLEEEIEVLFEDIRTLKSQNKTNASNINQLQKNQLICYQKVGIVRYDAFREMGGKLSFSIAMLDKQDNGFIMNSVHSSAGCYTYTKEIQNGNSGIDLGDEEKEALQKAMNVVIPVADEIKEENVNRDDA